MRFVLLVLVGAFCCVIAAQANDNRVAPAPRMVPDNRETPDPALIDLKENREAITIVSTQWKFHPGNDLQWAQPGFDDREWKLLKVGKDWNSQGYSEEQNQAWFRFSILVPANTPGLVIQMPSITKNYQLFADGQLVGQVGGLPPERSDSTVGAARVFTLPVMFSAQPRKMTLALRMWQSPKYSWFWRNAMGPVQVGSPETELPQFARYNAWNLLRREGMSYTTVLIQIPILAAALLLFRLTRKSFYLWFALNMALGAAELANSLLGRHFAWHSGAEVRIAALVDFAGQLTLGMFLMGWLELRRFRWVGWSILFAALAELGPLLVEFHLSFGWADGLYFVFVTVSEGILFWLVLRAWRQGVAEAGLFLIPYALSSGVGDLGNLGHFLQDAGVPAGSHLISGDLILLQNPFAVSLSDFEGILSLFGFLAILVYRFARTSREEQRLSAALQAAHDIQTRLVPDSHSVHGDLRAEVVYLAAEEVGGDFCQILPRPDGSVLVVIGDVSGKGLKAAMLGAIAVGALQSMIEIEVTPASLLRRMNEIMVRSDEPVFITCLCLEIARDGRMTVANAGHPSPYLNGIEMETAPAIPLGMARAIRYEEKLTFLPPQARVTLLSDGVVEARSKSGELFGFERTLEISARRAGEIAAAAKQFGQEDDITVITLDWAATLVAL